MVGGAAHSSENVQTNPIPWVRYAFSLVPSLVGILELLQRH